MSKKIQPVADTAPANNENKSSAETPKAVTQPVVGKVFTEDEKQKLESYDKLEKINGDLTEQMQKLQDTCAEYLDEIEQLKKQLEEVNKPKIEKIKLAAPPPAPIIKPGKKPLPLRRTFANVYRNNSTNDGYSSWN